MSERERNYVISGKCTIVVMNFQITPFHGVFFSRSPELSTEFKSYGGQSFMPFVSHRDCSVKINPGTDEHV